MVSGWQIFSKEEMNNDNAIKVFSDMIQNFDYDIPKWKEDCGMRKLLECQREACYKAIAALNAVVEQILNSSFKEGEKYMETLRDGLITAIEDYNDGELLELNNSEDIADYLMEVIDELHVSDNSIDYD